MNQPTTHHASQYTLAAYGPGGHLKAIIPIDPAPREDLRELACYFAHRLKADSSWWVMAYDQFGEQITQWGGDDLDRYRRLLDGESMTTTQTLLATGEL